MWFEAYRARETLRKRWGRLRWLLVLFIGLLGPHVQSHSSTDVVDVVRYITGYASADHEDIVALPNHQWQVTNTEVNFGYVPDVHWFRIDLNPSQLGDADLLHIAYPQLDTIELSHFSSGKVIKRYSVGDTLPFAKRPIIHRQFVFPLDFSLEGPQTLLLRIQTEGALRVPIRFWAERDFFAHAADENFLLAFFFGMLLVMALFNLLIFFAIRDASYLAYVIFTVSIALVMGAVYGYAYQYVYPLWPAVHSQMMLLMLPFAHIGICIFTLYFFDFRTSSRFWYRVFMGLIGISGALMLVTFVVPYNIATRIGILMTFPVSLVAVFVGFRFWKLGVVGGKWFALAWMAFLIEAVGIAASQLGWVPNSIVIEQGLLISVIVQAVLFALALTTRVTAEKEARIKAQGEHLTELNKRHEAELQLVHAASHHEITGLPNRQIFEKAVKVYLQKTKSFSPQVAVVLLHIRRFDDVNKTLGHRNADKLLRQIAERMDRAIGEHGTALAISQYQFDQNQSGPVYVAHIEGVSFCFAHICKDVSTLMGEVEALTDYIAVPMEFSGLTIEVDFIIGCSVSDEANSDPQTLLRQAFVAFDMANRSHSKVAIYEPEMNPYSPRRLTLMAELRIALDREGLSLAFQPKIDVQDGALIGFEALLRWTHARYGFVPPDEFIPMAERSGLMKPLTRWVIHEALNFLSLLEQQDSTVGIAVNISALNLREPDFCDAVLSLLKDSGIAPDRLTLELTETATMVDPELATRELTRLHDQGIRIAIDDFGTGHSSLAYIRQLPINSIKIDRSFVSDMAINPDDATIVKTTINMAHDLGYFVVAEGVETVESLTMLRGMQCNEAQGYLISRPMTRSQVFEWIEKGAWKAVEGSGKKAS